MSGIIWFMSLNRVSLLLIILSKILANSGNSEIGWYDFLSFGSLPDL